MLKFHHIYAVTGPFFKTVQQVNSMFNEFQKQCEKLAGKVEIPPKGIDADLAAPCFEAAKKEGRSPVEIAKELEAKFKKLPNLIQKIEAKGPYLNFYINYDEFSKLVIDEISRRGDKYGSADKKKTVVIEYSSPNIAKPLTIGHLSTTIMGQALNNIYTFLGYKVISDNHLGDWGTQFGKLIYAYKTWGDKAKVEKNPIEELLELYVKFHREAETNEKLNDEARAWFKRLEDGDKEAKEIWEWFVEVSLREFDRMYRVLGVKFDHSIGESFYMPMLKDIIQETLKKKVSKEENGAIIATFDDMPTALVQKSDGATLYLTRDLATIKYQKKEFRFWKRLYVVGSEQRLHFRQVFRMAELLGYIKEGECVHVDVGQISLPTGRISTRKGNVVFMEDVVNKTIEMAKETLKKKNPDLKNSDEVAKAVAIGAIKYSNLSRDRVRDMKFDWNEILSFEGDTGPYLQYTYARANSILKKTRSKPSKNPVYEEAVEQSIIKKLSQFSYVLERSAEENKPNLIANYIFELATLFNEFYHTHKVIGSDDEAKRIALIKSVMQVIENGLDLLGVSVLDEM